MGITLSNYAFTEPILLNNWSPPYKAGIYSIFKYDTTYQPKPYKPLYIGESGNMSERGFTSHHARSCWIREAGSENKLFIAVYLMPNSTPEQRKKIETDLINAYNPDCN